MPSETYRQWVSRVWDRLERRTERTVFYLDAKHIASYCPACGDGTIRIGFVDSDPPRATVTSNERPRCCSFGCSSDAILSALA